LRKLHNCYSYRPADFAEQQDIEDNIKNINNVIPGMKLKFD
jgi:hypothetical protein